MNRIHPLLTFRRWLPGKLQPILVRRLILILLSGSFLFLLRGRLYLQDDVSLANQDGRFDVVSKTKSVKSATTFSVKSNIFGRNDSKWKGFPRNRYILNNPNVCSHSVPEIIAVVESAIGHVENRQLIRQNWASDDNKAKYKMAVVFLFGKTLDGAEQALLEEESDHFHDIVQVDHLDTYYNLTKKSVAMLEWIQQHCAKAEFVLKSDDDMLIFMDNLSAALHRYRRSHSKFFLCAVRKKIEAIRKNGYKWYMSEKEYPGAFYPTHCSGTAYSFSMPTVAVLLDNSRTMPPIWLEDVYVTGLLATSIPHIHSPDFIFWTVLYPNKCRYKRRIAVHGLTVPQLKQIYSALRTCRN